MTTRICKHVHAPAGRIEDGGALTVRRGAAQRRGMSKVFAVLILAMMVVHLFKPLGLPGLRRRADFWKLAVLALAAISLTAALSHWT